MDFYVLRMIIFKNATLFRRQKLLFENANLQIQNGWRLGVIGKNGVGKTSLFALLLGELSTEAGDVKLPQHIKISHIAQEIHNPKANALDFVLSADSEIIALQNQLQIADANNDGAAIAHLHEALHFKNAYSAKARALQILSGLGFEADVETKTIAEFSGGWQMRLNLARALFAPADLLLLDEPTNHLDLDAVLWLASWLKKSSATLFVISHDRDFLDETTDHILSFENNHLHLQHGNYSRYEETLANRQATQTALYKKQQLKIAHLEDFVRRFRYKATKASQAQSRLKMLEKLKIVAAVQAESPFSFEFENAALPAQTLMTLENVTAKYVEKSVFENLNCTIDAGARIGLLGKNGAGKSTLIKIIAGVLKPFHGTILRAKNLKIGYFAQHSVDALNAADSAFDHLQKLAPNSPPLPLREFLGRFHFSNDKVFAPINEFSGGEKARLALALIVFQKPHLLLLDEPTNHLDMAMRQALTLALQSFEGAMILVSHDRHLLKNNCDEFWLVNNGISEFSGDLEDYANLLLKKESAPNTTPKTAKINKRQAQKEERAQFLAQKRLLKKNLDFAESQLELLNQRQKNLDALFLSTEFLSKTPKQKADLQKESAELLKDLETAENLYLEALEAFENFQNAFENSKNSKNPRSTENFFEV